MQKAPGILPGAFCLIMWHRPTLEGPCGPTTIGAGGLNCRVRDGNGWDPTAMSATNLIPTQTSSRSSRRSGGKAAYRRTFSAKSCSKA